MSETTNPENVYRATDKTKLLPCPFCGEKAQIEKQGFGEDAQFFLSCDEGNGCSVAVVGESEKEVIDEWNSAYACTLVKELAGALEKSRNILSEARELLGVFEDNGGHDGLSGKGYTATLDHIGEVRLVAKAVLAKVPAALR